MIQFKKKNKYNKTFSDIVEYVDLLKVETKEINHFDTPYYLVYNLKYKYNIIHMYENK